MTKPIIPRDLKPGDRLWYSRDKYAVIGDDASWVMYRPMKPESIHAWDDRGDGCGRRYYENGTEIDGDTPPITRIERIASASASASAKAGKVKGGPTRKVDQRHSGLT